MEPKLARGDMVMCWGRMVIPPLPIADDDGPLPTEFTTEAVELSPFESVKPLDAVLLLELMIEPTVAMFHGEKTPSVLIPEGVGGDMGYFINGA